MHKSFFIGDTHFGHSNILQFKRDDGTPLRVFDSIEQHDEHMIERWNSVVRPCDKVYHLGDVVINRRCLPILGRLNGKKRLIRGNHDIFKTSEYMQYFEEVLAYRVFGEQRIICSHIPIHPESVARWTANVHGHLHYRKLEDPKYLCVSVEHINYTPIELEEVLERIRIHQNS